MEAPELIPPLLVLYAETHFRFFRLQPSFLYRRAPEIVFDMPRRTMRGTTIPVSLVINDIDKFPVEIQSVTIAISQHGRTTIGLRTGDIAAAEVHHPLTRHSRAYLFAFPSSQLETGEFFVNCTAEIHLRGQTRHVLNDNLPTTSKAPFRGWLTEEPLPVSSRAAYGDLHVHSHYSRSHVEFGPPLSVIRCMANAYGLDFVALTDHSYDLCSRSDNYLAYDPDARRWQMMMEETKRTATATTELIVGEEVSAANERGRTVHLCGLGLSRFVPGSRDGARFDAPKNTTLTLDKAMRAIHDQGGVTMAAHPGARPGMLERVLLGRGSWDARDVSDKLDVFQALNDGFAGSWYRARRLWIERLLDGMRLPLAAGNDSHGDFNRYRSIGIPFLSIHENPHRHLSYSRTGIYAKPAGTSAIIDALRRGRTFVTTGPFIDCILPHSPEKSLIGEEIPLRECTCVTVTATSTYEFGSPCLLRVFRGDYASRREKPLVVQDMDGTETTVAFRLELDRGEEPGYIRAEVVCRRTDGQTTQAVTSPWYLT
jgi:hypothetical protein